MIVDNRNEEEYRKCRYFNFNGMPIRTIYQDGRNPVEADTVDPENGRLIAAKTDLITPTETDPDVEEVTQSEFFELCEHVMQKHLKQRIKLFEKAIAECDVVGASRLITELYESWDRMEIRDLENIKSLEPVYLTIVNVAMHAAERGKEDNA